MRVVLLTGKGGVGKTTVAAATAVHAARSGVKSLVLSTDAAHSLGDALGRHLPPDDVTEVEPGLCAQHVDGGPRLQRTWGAVQAYVLDAMQALGVEPLAAAELSGLPGAEDVLTLLALRDQVACGPWDLVVVDCAPTAETLRLLALPEALTRLVDRVLPSHRALARAMAPAVGRATRLRAPGREVGVAMLRLRRELAEALAVVRSPATSVRVVLTPESVVLAEARRTLTALSLQDFTVDAVVANRVLPDVDGSPWQRGWVRAQRAVLEEARMAFAPVPLTTVPYLNAEPVGPNALAVVGKALYGAGGVEAILAVPDRPRPLRVEVDGADFVLELDLPQVQAADVDLARRGDDLLIAVAGHRRVLALPAALCRCQVAGARIRDGVLTVRFVRDPGQWPAR